MLVETQLAEVFDADLRVPSITSIQALNVVLREVELFPSDEEREHAIAQIEAAGFGKESGGYGGRMEIGVKKLLSAIEMARQEPENVSERLVSVLMGLKM